MTDGGTLVEPRWVRPGASPGGLGFPFPVLCPLSPARSVSGWRVSRAWFRGSLSWAGFLFSRPCFPSGPGRFGGPSGARLFRPRVSFRARLVWFPPCPTPEVWVRVLQIWVCKGVHVGPERSSSHSPARWQLSVDLRSALLCLSWENWDFLGPTLTIRVPSHRELGCHTAAPTSGEAHHKVAVEAISYSSGAAVGLLRACCGSGAAVGLVRCLLQQWFSSGACCCSSGRVELWAPAGFLL